MINNPLKSKLVAGEVVIGSFVYIPSAALAEIMGLAGFDLWLSTWNTAR
jgi:2-keto-3-deoxy-L-rhamnonate aldolase RhmA